MSFKITVINNYHVIKWIAVRYKNDGILYMCPYNIYKKTEIGTYCYIKWTDGFRYKAKLLKKGSKEEIEAYLNNLKQIQNNDVKSGDKSTVILKPLTSNLGVSTQSISSSCTLPDISDDLEINEKEHNLMLNHIPVYDTAAVLKLQNSNLGISTQSISSSSTLPDISNDIIEIIEKEHNLMLNHIPVYDTAAVLKLQNSNLGISTQSISSSCTLPDISNDIIEIIEKEHNLMLNHFPVYDTAAELKLQNSNIVSSSEPEFDDEIHNKYSNLRPKSISDLKHTTDNDISSCSEFSEYDSGSDYVPYGDKLSISSFDSFENDSVISDDLHSFGHKSENINVCVPNTTTQRYNFDSEVETGKKKMSTNKRIWDKTDNCLFCEQNVTNFTRHILKKHINEMEVARFASFPKGSIQRKIQADLLRKRGNFLHNVGGYKIKPVRRPYALSVNPVSGQDYLPCKYCFGSYKKKYLSRHVQKCKHVKEKTKNRTRPQADGQNLLIAFADLDENLVKNVFPRMASDLVSINAKSDKLITAFGARYLKSHKEKHLIAVVSQKMRLLARFVMAMKIEISSIKSLKDCLQPKFFDTIVKCSKQVAKYDENIDKFKSPSVILKLGQSLKQCCDIAEFMILKENDGKLRDTLEKEKESIKNIRYMISSNWSYELSTNASKELYQAKWNKPALLQLTSDIQLFRNYLINVENESFSVLKSDPNNMEAYRLLQESILTQIILLNRRRGGEVQRILLDTYNNAQCEISQEEIELSLSPIEIELTRSFKRIVIRGKRGRGVPILFTPHLQQRLQYLIKLRETVSFINCKNPYLFPLPQTSSSCMRASDVIRKFGKQSGAKHAENITSTRLRKHVATVTQILNLSEGDIEQLATFMGHTKNVHKDFYRLSDNAFQVAKISKLLLLMEQGKGHEYRGKSLDEIEININNLVSDEEPDFDEDDNNETDEDQVNQNQQTNVSKLNKILKLPNNKNKIQNIPKKKVVIIPWTEEEKHITTTFFKKHILSKTAPRKQECEQFVQLNPQFTNKSWRKIKDFVNNTGRAFLQKKK